ncbi:type II toxin-antitoxin system HicB family antitoxin [Alsobacter sp. KACC 23698]|uniref:Type II toxin-antitoxin system HicB family antitoxin n=1 Tax=Alsobacter sp. KACC 23698 TaxID=3149229 RepID=A0AAU7JBY5_9HYPH
MRLSYPVEISPLSDEDGGGYLATAPDLPGCMSDGETPEEALHNVLEAIESWLDAARSMALEVPPPRRIPVQAAS